MTQAAVVGAGLAGSVAALALAEAGFAVRRVAKGPGATAMTGGAVDIAGASPGVPELPWRDPLRGTALCSADRLGFLLSGLPRHPYRKVFGPGREPLAERASAAAKRLAAWLDAEGLGLEGSLQANRLLPTAQGTLRITDLALSGPAEADLTGTKRVILVDLPGVEGWDARGCARTLVSEIDTLGLGPLPVEVVRSRKELNQGAEAPARIAARLDQKDGEAKLAAALEGIGRSGDLVLLPQIVGLSRTRALLAAVSGERRVGEVIAFPPHALAGYRLTRALDRACAKAGVVDVRGQVGRVAARGSRYRIEPDSEHSFEAFESDTVVLATGRFIGGGLVSGPEGVREPLLGLPVTDPDGRRVDGIPAHRSVRKGYASVQPLYGAGVEVDASLHPQPSVGEGLWAAGEWLGGFDPARERTGLGVALLTGLAAGERAALHLQEARG